jgi:predicted RNase H-like HicB family nuclease
MMITESMARERTRWRGAALADDANADFLNGGIGALLAGTPSHHPDTRAAGRPAGYVAIVAGRPGNYHVVLPDLPALTARGDTMDAALADAAVAVRHWCEAAIDRGESLPEPRSAEEAVHGDPDMVRLIGEDAALALVPLLPEVPVTRTIALALDADLVAAVDELAEASGLDRADFIADALEAALARRSDDTAG